MAMLTAILLPALQESREAARRAHCVNNLHQIVLAYQSHTDLQQWFPSANGLTPTKKGDPRLYSAFTSLLPFLERKAEFNAINFETPLWDLLDVAPASQRRDSIDPANITGFGAVIDTFLCPSDPLPPAVGRTGGVSYRANLGDGVAVGRGGRDQIGPFSGIGLRIGPRDVTDGLSNTAAFSERLRGHAIGAPLDPGRDILLARMRFGLDPEEALAKCPYQVPGRARFKCCAGTGWPVASLTQTSYNHWNTPNSTTPDCGLGFFMPIEGRVGARSQHRGGVSVALGDGSVRSMANGMEPRVWRALGTIAGGEVARCDNHAVEGRSQPRSISCRWVS